MQTKFHFAARALSGAYLAEGVKDKFALTDDTSVALPMSLSVSDDGRVSVRVKDIGWLDVNDSRDAVIRRDSDCDPGFIVPSFRLLVGPRGSVSFRAPRHCARVASQGEEVKFFVLVDVGDLTTPVLQLPKRIAEWAAMDRDSRLKFNPLSHLGTFGIVSHHGTVWTHRHELRWGTVVANDHVDKQALFGLKAAHFDIFVNADFSLSFQHVPTKVWVCAEFDGRLVCNRAACSDWETFRVALDMRRGDFGLFSHHGRYVCANAPGEGHGSNCGMVSADRMWLHDWEHMRFVRVRDPQPFKLFNVPTSIVPNGQVRVDRLTLGGVKKHMDQLLGPAVPFALMTCDANGVVHLEDLMNAPAATASRKALKQRVSANLSLIFGAMAETVNARRVGKGKKGAVSGDDVAADHNDDKADVSRQATDDGGVDGVVMGIACDDADDDPAPPLTVPGNADATESDTWSEIDAATE